MPNSQIIARTSNHPRPLSIVSQILGCLKGLRSERASSQEITLTKLEKYLQAAPYNPSEFAIENTNKKLRENIEKLSRRHALLTDRTLRPSKNQSIIFSLMTIEKIYYVTDAYVSSYNQGTDLLIVKARSGEIFGLSPEFEICTKDIEIVSGQYSPDRPYSQAQWVDFCSEIGTAPAGWADISGTDIADLVVGYRLESDLQIHRFK